MTACCLVRLVQKQVRQLPPSPPFTNNPLLLIQTDREGRGLYAWVTELCICTRNKKIIIFFAITKSHKPTLYKQTERQQSLLSHQSLLLKFAHNGKKLRCDHFDIYKQFHVISWDVLLVRECVENDFQLPPLSCSSISTVLAWVVAMFGFSYSQMAVAAILSWVDFKSWSVVEAHPLKVFLKFHENPVQWVMKSVTQPLLILNISWQN